MAERRRETGDDRPLAELYDVVPGAAANPTTTATTTTDRKDSACSDTEREVIYPCHAIKSYSKAFLLVVALSQSFTLSCLHY